MPIIHAQVRSELAPIEMPEPNQPMEQEGDENVGPGLAGQIEAIPSEHPAESLPGRQPKSVNITLTLRWGTVTMKLNPLNISSQKNLELGGLSMGPLIGANGSTLDVDHMLEILSWLL